MAYPSDLARTKDWGTEILTDTDLEGQLDLTIAWIMAAMDRTTGHTHDGTANEGGPISPANLVIASQAEGDMLYASSATAWARLGIGTALQILRTNSGADTPEWADLDDTMLPDGSVVQIVNTTVSAVDTTTTAIPFDDTIPRKTEGKEFMSLSITPKSATNKLKIEVVLQGSMGTGNGSRGAIALFQDDNPNALAAGYIQSIGDNTGGGIPEGHGVLIHYMDAGTTSATTFKVHAGNSSATTFTFNGSGGVRRFGGVCSSSITITEIKAS